MPYYIRLSSPRVCLSYIGIGIVPKASRRATRAANLFSGARFWSCEAWAIIDKVRGVGNRTVSDNVRGVEIGGSFSKFRGG